MKKKKIGRYVLVAVVTFALGIWTGYSLLPRFVAPQQEAPLAAENSVAAPSTAAEAASFSFISQYTACAVSGERQVSADENPWETTIGVIDMEDIGKVLFMTPMTEVSAQVRVPENGVLVISGRIHPWMAAQTDGATLSVTVADTQQLIHYTADGDFQTDRIDLSAYAGQAIQIRMECLQEANASGDWVILSAAEVEAGLPAASSVAEASEGQDYWITAFYFADGYPIEFWDCEWNTLDADLEQIKNDGFNSIALVVPWRQFQPNISTTSDGATYDEGAFQRLEKMIQKADAYGLGVILRVGYHWDRYDDQSPELLHDRFFRVLFDETTQRAWMDYLAKLKGTVDQYPNVWGGFICWEDFWHFPANMLNGFSAADAQNLAQETGFQAFVESAYGLEQYNRQFLKTYASIEEIQLPDRTDQALSAFYEFYDEQLNLLLEKSQGVWPELSMEVRTDADLVVDSNGAYQYYSHKDTYPCGSAAYTSVMYGIPQGARNEGERLSGEEAIRLTRNMFDLISASNEGKPLFINQFLFYDNTEGYESNAQLIEEEIDDYLQLATGLLAERTMGYGIWTYHDYYVNAVYNKDFYRGLTGWEAEGPVELIASGENQQVKILPQGVLRQAVDQSYVDLDESVFVNLIVHAQEACTVSIQVGAEVQESSVAPGTTELALQFSLGEAETDLRIWADHEVVVDNVNMYSDIQQGRVYDSHGEASANRDDVVALNAAVWELWRE